MKDSENYMYMNPKMGMYAKALEEAEEALQQGDEYKGMTGDTLQNWCLDMKRCCQRNAKVLHPEFEKFPSLEGYKNKATIKTIDKKFLTK